MVYKTITKQLWSFLTHWNINKHLYIYMTHPNHLIPKIRGFFKKKNSVILGPTRQGFATRWTHKLDSKLINLVHRILIEIAFVNVTYCTETLQSGSPEICSCWAWVDGLHSEHLGPKLKWSLLRRSQPAYCTIQCKCEDNDQRPQFQSTRSQIHLHWCCPYVWRCHYQC